MNVRDKIRFIIANCCRIDESRVDDKAQVNVTENWDSLTHLQIMICIEEEFKVNLDASTISNLTSLKEILSFLKTNKNRCR